MLKIFLCLYWKCNNWRCVSHIDLKWLNISLNLFRSKNGLTNSVPDIRYPIKDSMIQEEKTVSYVYKNREKWNKWMKITLFICALINYKKNFIRIVSVSTITLINWLLYYFFLVYMPHSTTMLMFCYSVLCSSKSMVVFGLSPLMKNFHTLKR